MQAKSSQGRRHRPPPSPRKHRSLPGLRSLKRSSKRRRSSSFKKPPRIMGFERMSIAKRRHAGIRKSRMTTSKLPSIKTLSKTPYLGVIISPHSSRSNILMSRRRRSSGDNLSTRSRKVKRRSADEMREEEPTSTYIMGFAPRSIAKRNFAHRLAAAELRSLFESAVPKKKGDVFIRISSLAPKKTRTRKSTLIRRSGGDDDKTRATGGLRKALLTRRYESKLASYLSSRGYNVPGAPRKRGKRSYTEFSTSPTKYRFSQSASSASSHRPRPRLRATRTTAKAPSSRLTATRMKRSPPRTPQKSRRRQRAEPTSPTRFRRSSSK